MPEKSYNRYIHERRRRWPYIIVAAVCVFLALAAWQAIGVPRVSAVTPGPDAYVRMTTPSIVLDVHGLASLKGVRVTLDGRDVTASTSQDGDRLTLSNDTLADGTHSVSFTASSSNLLRHTVRKQWHFTVDTSVPTLTLAGSSGDGRINTSPATFAGTTEPRATVTVSNGTVKASGTADTAGHYAVSAALPDGPSQVTITASDRAGNTTSKSLAVYVDASPPTLKVSQLTKVVKHSGLKMRIKALDNIRAPKLTAVLDGERVKLSGTASKALLKVKSLAQGRHTLLITAEDHGGNVVKDQQTFLIDSTEHFGSSSLWPGARGKDVRVLQNRLTSAGVYSGKKTGVYDHRTEVAVKSFQAKYGLTVDGLVGGGVLNALSGQIIVDLGSLRLYLYRDGHLVKSYPVATGQPAYPTPTGTFAIIDMQKDPTWLPPNSDWARNATPIQPGTENPLGTRWMGTSAPGVGMHGVPPSEDGTIGTYASHGCIRMHNWDAVDLFSRVCIGMPVIIRP